MICYTSLADSSWPSNNVVVSRSVAEVLFWLIAPLDFLHCRDIHNQSLECTHSSWLSLFVLLFFGQVCVFETFFNRLLRMWRILVELGRAPYQVTCACTFGQEQLIFITWKRGADQLNKKGWYTSCGRGGRYILRFQLTAHKLLVGY